MRVNLSVRKSEARARTKVTFIMLYILALFISGCISNDDKDTEPPTITATISPLPNTSGWHNVDATVTFQCEDNSKMVLCSNPVLVDMDDDNQTITGTAIDQAGNISSVSVIVNLDKTAPILSDYFPSDGAVLQDPEVNLVGKVSDILSGVGLVTCEANGVSDEAIINSEADENTSVFACNLPLDLGSNIITVNGTDIAGNTIYTSLTFDYIPLPNIAINSPEDGALLLTTPVTVTGTTDDVDAKVMVNNVSAVVSNGTFTASVSMDNGFNTITAKATNVSGSISSSVNVIAIIGPKPTIQILSPQPEFVLGKEQGKSPYALSVIGWLRDNQIVPAGVPVVTVNFNGSDVNATVTQETSPYCKLPNRCWKYNATMEFSQPGVNLVIDVEGKIGNETSSKRIAGIVDFCYRNNGTDLQRTEEACAVSLFQEPGHELVLENRQSRICIFGSDGCSNPVFPERKDDPTGGRFGLISTTFGESDTETTVFGQKRQSKLPCNRHDECYHTRGPAVTTKAGVVEDKFECNERFLRDMRDVCRRAYPETVCPSNRIGLKNCPRWRLEKRSCYNWAFIYTDAVNADTGRYLLDRAYESNIYNGHLNASEGCPSI